MSRGGRVESKVAIVTGGALGIGRATCLLLAKEGAKVAVADILEKEGQEVVDEIKGLGGVAKFYKNSPRKPTPLSVWMKGL